MSLRILVSAAAVLAVANPPQEAPVSPRLDEFVKAWSDARFWVHSGGARVGWQRYQLRWGDYEGEKMVVVEFERATSIHYSDRFTAWLRPNEFLSPRAVRWADNGDDLRIENGKIGRYFGHAAPENLTLFPELLAAFRTLKEDEGLEFSALGDEAEKAGPGTLKGMAPESPPGSKEKRPAVGKVRAAWKTRLGFDQTFWVKDQRIAHMKSKVTMRSGPPRLEELVPADANEWAQGDVATNEMRAVAQLGQLTSMIARFGSHDEDGNGKIDFWSGDVSGLYRNIPPKRTVPIAMIAREFAMADASPLPAGPQKGGGTISEALGPKPVPLHGYFFKALSKGVVRGGPVPLNDGTNRNQDMFGFCAYPADYGKSGRMTFFITEDNQPYWMDLKGQPITDVPANPRAEGWQWR